MAFQTTYAPDGRLRVAILGCTGSIGTQTLDVCRQHADRLQVTALSVNSSTSELVAFAREFSVPAVAVADVAHGADAVLQELPEGTSSVLVRRRFASSHVAMTSTVSLLLLWALPGSKRAMLP